MGFIERDDALVVRYQRREGVGEGVQSDYQGSWIIIRLSGLINKHGWGLCTLGEAYVQEIYKQQWDPIGAGCLGWVQYWHICPDFI